MTWQKRASMKMIELYNRINSSSTITNRTKCFLTLKIKIWIYPWSRKKTINKCWALVLCWKKIISIKSSRMIMMTLSIKNMLKIILQMMFSQTISTREVLVYKINSNWYQARILSSSLPAKAVYMLYKLETIFRYLKL